MTLTNSCSEINQQVYIRFQEFVISHTVISKKPRAAEGVWYAEMSSGNDSMPCRVEWYHMKQFQKIRICFRHTFHTD